MYSPDDFGMSFSTLVAPEQTVNELVETARSSGYSGIEFHITGPGRDDHAHGLEPDISQGGMADIRKELADGGVTLSCISTELELTTMASEAAIDLAKKYITLAEAMSCTVVRLLGGPLSTETELAGQLDRIADTISEIVEFAEKTGVTVLIETKGDFATTKYVRELIKQVYSDSFGVSWNLVETTKAMEKLDESYDNIAGKVKHVHIADYSYVDGRMSVDACDLGEGVVDAKSAIKYLAHDGFEGYLSVATTLTPADDALLQHAQVLHDCINEVFPSEDDDLE